MGESTLMRQNNHIPTVKGILKEIVQSNVPLSFNQIHIVVALHLLLHLRSLGRYRLSNELAISGTTARTILRRLQKQEIVTATSKGGLKKGHTLTEKGSTLALEIKSRAAIFSKAVNLGPLTVGKVDAIVHVPARWVKDNFRPLEARDSAVSVGAKGCTVINYGKNGLEVGDEILSESSIRKLPLSHVQPSDLLHVGTADTFEIARLGAVAASLCSWKKE